MPPEHAPFWRCARLLCLCLTTTSCAMGATELAGGSRATGAPPPLDRDEPQADPSGAGQLPVPDEGTEVDCSSPSGPLDSDGDSVPNCEDECPRDPTGDTLTSWHPDCDGDGEFASQPITACSEVDANRQSRCAGGQAPDGGWSDTAGTDCNDEDPQNLCRCGTQGPAGDSVCTPLPATAASCLEILMDDASAPDGTYAIDPDGAGAAPALQVTCDMGAGGWTILHRSDFSDGNASGWEDLEGGEAALDLHSDCAETFGPMLGGVSEFGEDSGATQTFDLHGIPHTEIALSLDFIVLDSWDGEDGRVLLDGDEVFGESYDFRDADDDVCGDDFEDEGAQPVNVQVAHSDDEATVTVTSTLDQEADNESFGVANIELRIR